MKMRLSSSFLLLLSSLLLQLVQMRAAANADHHSVGRRVAIGDFEAINTLLEGASIVLPPSKLQDNGLELNIDTIYCTDIHLGDLNTNYTIGVNALGQDTLFYTLRAFPFDMNCFADYSFTFGFFFSGSGRFEAFTDNNEVTAHVDLISPSQFAVAPPNRAEVPFCQSVIRTDGNINFEDGGLLDGILNLGIVKDLISNLIDSEAADILCGEIEVLGDTLFADLLNSTTFMFDEWLPPLPTDWTDPLFAEDNFVAPDGVTLLDFQQQDNSDNSSSTSSVGDLFVSLLDEADEFFGEIVTDEETGETDLGINFFLRDLFLDENGALDLSLDELQAELDGAAAADDGALLDTHDTLTQTSVLVDAVRLQGLDTLQAFNPFVMTGKHTIGNQFVWNSLALEIDLTLDVKPSSLDDSILQNANPEANLVEQFTISFDFNNLNVDFALFLPINEAKFEALTLGSLLDSENILPCFVSSLEALEVAGLDVFILDITPPVMEGFVSPGIGRVLSQLADAVFAAYRPTILRAVPGLFQGPIRDVLQSGLIDGGLFGTVGGGDGSECPNTPPPTGNVDFRDLFLDPEQALILGGSGEEPYGDVGSLIYGLLLDGLEDAGEDGTPKINEMLIRPFTKEQSGQEGVLRFNDTLIEVWHGRRRRRRQRRCRHETNAAGTRT